MKIKIVVAIVLAGILCLSGCKVPKTTEKEQNKVTEENKSDKEEEEEKEMQAYRTPTEKEWGIIEGCNLSDDYMTEIKEKGMSMSVQSFVDTAQIMLDYLVEKYDEEFEVMGGEIPGIISGDYMIFASAVDGEYAGERFEVYYRTDEDGKGYCEDGYFAIVKRMEVQEYLQNIAKEVGTDIKVIVSLNSVVGKEYTTKTTLDEIKGLNRKKEVNIFIHGYVSPEISEEEFQQQVQELEKCLRKTGFRIHYGVERLVSNEIFDEISNWNDVLRELLDPYDKEEKYDLSYDEYIKMDEK